MKQLIVVFLFCILTLEVLGQTQTIMNLPVEIDTVINGIEAKFIYLDISFETRKSSFAKMAIGFRDPVTQEWIWFDAANVPFRWGDGSFTHSFPLKIRWGFENRDVRFLYSIIETKDGTFYVAMQLYE